jgi:hypothetical protein
MAIISKGPGAETNVVPMTAKASAAMIPVNAFIMLISLELLLKNKGRHMT